MTAPTHLKVDEQLCHALHAACSAITRAYRPRLAEAGLTYPQYLVMMVLWDQGLSAVGQIAGALGVSSHAITPIITRLEQAGLVTRSADATDRRLSLIAPTATGYAIEARAIRAQNAVATDAGLSTHELEQLRDQLAHLTSHLSAATTGPHKQDVVAPTAQTGQGGSSVNMTALISMTAERGSASTIVRG